MSLTPTFRLAMSLGISTSNDEQTIGINPQGEGIAASAEDGVGAGTATAPAGDLRDGQWHFLVGRFVSDALREASADNGPFGQDTTNIDYTLGGRFRIGLSAATNENFPWEGDLDQLAIFTRALTDDELTWLYNSHFGRSFTEIQTDPDSNNPGTGDLLAHYSVNEDFPGGYLQDDTGAFDLTQIGGGIMSTTGIAADS